MNSRDTFKDIIIIAPDEYCFHFYHRIRSHAQHWHAIRPYAWSRKLTFIIFQSCPPPSSLIHHCLSNYNAYQIYAQSLYAYRYRGTAINVFGITTARRIKVIRKKIWNKRWPDLINELWTWLPDALLRNEGGNFYLEHSIYRGYLSPRIWCSLMAYQL